MLHELLGLIQRATEVRPTFHAARCLAVRQSPAACTRCADVCPHDAVTVRPGGVEIDPLDCTGCGICVQACPSQALEPNVRLGAGRSAKCSRVDGDAQTVTCLARLRPTDLHALARGRDDVVLAHGDCARCDVGDRSVPDRVRATIDDAQALLRLRGTTAVHLRLERRDRLDDDGGARTLDRRALLRGGWDGAKRGAADLLAPLDTGPDSEERPAEARRRWRALELADLAHDAPVTWPVPRVSDACILCPVCTRVCPTDAFARRYDDDGGGALMLTPDRCVGCDACVAACPVDAITMDATPAWGEIAHGPSEAFRRAPDRPDATGTVPREP